MRFFDISCTFGITPAGKGFRTKTDILEEMGRLCIEKAVISPPLSPFSLRSANDYLLKKIGSDARLVPAWYVCPDKFFGFTTPDEITKLMIESGVKIARLVLQPFGIPPDIEMLEGILKSLTEKGIPLILDSTDLSFARRLTSANPDLNIIVTAEKLSDSAYSVLKLLDDYSNVKLDIASYQLYYGIEEICEQFGAERLVFGTRMPYFAGGPFVAGLSYARISAEEKELISHKNLERLLKFDA